MNPISRITDLQLELETVPNEWIVVMALTLIAVWTWFTLRPRTR